MGRPDRDDLGNLVAAGPGSSRVRMHARGRDQAHANIVAPDEPIEDHLLITWPAPAADETILKQTDQYGALHRETWPPLTPIKHPAAPGDGPGGCRSPG